MKLCLKCSVPESYNRYTLTEELAVTFTEDQLAASLRTTKFIGSYVDYDQIAAEIAKEIFNK